MSETRTYFVTQWESKRFSCDTGEVVWVEEQKMLDLVSDITFARQCSEMMFLCMDKDKYRKPTVLKVHVTDMGMQD